MPDLPDDIKSKVLDLELNLQTNPTPEDFSELADIYRTNGQTERATEICEKALEQFPKNPICLMTYARVLMDTGMFEEAEAVLEHVIKLGGEDVGALIMMGQLYTQRNDLAGIHSIAQKLYTQHVNDVRAKKFLKFLNSKKLLPPNITIDDTGITQILTPSLEMPEPPKPMMSEEPQIISPEQMATEAVKIDFPKGAEPAKKPPVTAQAIPEPVKRTPIIAPSIPESAKKPPERKATITVPMEDLLRIISMLKGISGVQHAILTDPGDKTMASSGCPNAIARAVGGLLRSMKRAMLVAFDALEFGQWTKGVIELGKSTIHLINVEGFWIALVCDPSVSLGALRIAVSSIISRHLKSSAIK